MTEAPPRPLTAQQSAIAETEDAQAAADVAAAIASGGTVAVVGAALIPAIPIPTLALLGPDLGGNVARETAEIVLREVPEKPESSDSGAFGEWLEELTYRGLYAVAAVRRLAAAASFAGGPLEERREALGRAVEAEGRFFRQHRDAQRRRDTSRKAMREAASLYGEVVSWRHGHPREPRPSHLAADGKNWRLADGPPAMTGVLPGVLSGCTCSAGPAKPGADMMVGSLRSASGSALLSEEDRWSMGIPVEDAEVFDLAYDLANPDQPKWPKGAPGGRGGKYRPTSALSAFLPNFKDAVIPKGKLTRAIEDETHGRVPRAIGFKAGDESELESKLREAVPKEAAKKGSVNEYGERYTVVAPVKGPNGKTAPITTGWIYRPGEDYPRSATIFGSRKQWRRWEREGRL